MEQNHGEAPSTKVYNFHDEHDFQKYWLQLEECSHRQAFDQCYHGFKCPNNKPQLKEAASLGRFLAIFIPFAMSLGLIDMFALGKALSATAYLGPQFRLTLHVDAAC